MNFVLSIHDPPVHPMSMKILNLLFAVIKYGRHQCRPICMSIFGASLKNETVPPRGAGAVPVAACQIATSHKYGIRQTFVSQAAPEFRI